MNMLFFHTFVVGGGVNTSPIVTASILLTGYILDDGGVEMVERGFNYGPTIDMTNSIFSESTTSGFSALVQADAGDFYFQSYAINTNGTSAGEVKLIQI